MTTFVLATANPDKAQEITDLLADAAPGLELVARPPEVPDVDEVGETLEDNARKSTPWTARPASTPPGTPETTRPTPTTWRSSSTRSMRCP